ncbi:hypothetical protein [Treponema vincentii]|uniref:hypothetical protein n=1 Tax=Treponema vincentii TaxID=69710 RepID=UPI0020A3ABEA|nr:hypothetical protein [Treponema vincentii]
MKKLRLISVSILFAALCLIFTACNQGLTAGKGTGTVRIVIDNGATRAVNAEGMPEFDETNTKITVTGEDGTELKKASGATPITLTLDIGKKINIKVVVTTEAGEWRGTKEHTVTAGTNTVAVKLSKAPKSVGNILSYVVKNDLYDSKITLKLVGKLPDEKLLVENSGIGGNYLDRPVIARDGSGRIYMLYDKDGRHLTRFDAEGNPHCEIPLNTLPSSARISTMTVDAKTNTIFVFDANSDNVYALTESGSKTFTLSAPFGMSSLASAASSSTITAAAAYNNVLFLVTKENKLIACKVTLSDTSLSLEEKAVETLESLRPSAVAGMTECTGAFADENNVYCLLREQKSDASQLYMVGALVHYTYSEGGLANKTVKGLHSKAGGNDPSLTFEEKAFVNPVGFIGYDEDYLYIADDGAEISENPYIDFCIAGNKNRIAKVNRDTFELFFEDSGTRATWFAEYAAQYAEKIPNVLWSTGKNAHKVTLELKTANGTKALASDVDWFKTARDSAGSVYVLYHKDSKLLLERFNADGKEDANFGTVKTPTLLNFDSAITDIAVDFKTGDVFLLKRKNNVLDPKLTVYMAKKTDEGYTEFSNAVMVTVPKDPGSPARIDSVAAFDGTLFFAMDVEVGSDDVKKLYAYKMQTAGSFSFTGGNAETELDELWQHPTKSPMVCTGLFADRKGVYGLLAQKNVIGGAAFYALGKIVRYTYDGSTQLTPVVLSGNNSGLNPAAANPGSIQYDEHYFSYPAGFLGYDGDTLYIADDGVNIEEVNENIYVNGNKDRIMAFNRKNNTLSASSLDLDGATWFKSYDKYTYPETKMLLWEKGSSQYWVGDNGTEAYSPSSALSITSSQRLTDVFCYDQNGNLYIVTRDGPDYKVKRFTPTDTGFNSTGDMKIKDESERPVSIAVDVSGGTNILYYGINDYSQLKWAVKKIEWQYYFDEEREPELFTSCTGEELTALAANKDGVFVGVKQIYEETVGGNQIPKYRLKVKKFLKGTHADGSVTVVENDPLYVSAPGSTNPYTPIPEPASSSHDPYIAYEEAISDLQVAEGTLYAIMAKTEKIRKYNTVEDACTIDEFKMSSALYKVGKAAVGFSGSAEELAEKSAVPPQGSNPGVGYGFYRFIAVKPKKLIIASDGAWGKEGNSASHVEADNNKVLTYDLDGNLNSPEEKNAAGKFSKELQRSSSGFNWE